MRFNALHLDQRRINTPGQYSQRMDGSLVIELDRLVPSTELRVLLSKRFNHICIEKYEEEERGEVYTGPFSLWEKYGVLVFSLIE